MTMELEILKQTVYGPLTAASRRPIVIEGVQANRLRELTERLHQLELDRYRRLP